MRIFLTNDNRKPIRPSSTIFPHHRYVPSQFLGDKVTTDRFRIGMKDENYGPTRWHECVSAVISSCLEETECTKDDLLEAAAAMPFLTEVRECKKVLKSS